MTSPNMNSGTPVVRVENAERGFLLKLVKRLVQTLFCIWVAPRLLTLMVMRCIVGREAFRYASESIARAAGLTGVYRRQAFYRSTLRHCGQDVYFGWNSVFSMHEAEVGDRVYIGKFCGIGFAKIEEEVMLADHVQILSGGNEHGDSDGNSTMHEQSQVFQRVTLGRGAWIGAGAIVMADVGEGAIVGAGAVVNRPIPPNCLAVGVPARVVKRLRAKPSPSPGPDATAHVAEVESETDGEPRRRVAIQRTDGNANVNRVRKGQ